MRERGFDPLDRVRVAAESAAMTLFAGLLTPVIVALAAAGCAPRERPVATVDPIPVLAWAVDELGKSRPYADSPYPTITQFYWLTEGNLTNVDLAVQMTRRQPEGRRVMTDWDVCRRMYRHPADQLKTTAGEAFTAFWWDRRLVMPGGRLLAPEPVPAPAGCWIVGPPDLTPREIENPPVP